MQASNKRRVVLYSTTALTLSGLVYGGFVYRSKPDVQTLLSCAAPQLRVGMLDHAETFVRQALEEEPDNFEGLTMLAAIYEGRGRKEEALALYHQLLPRSKALGMEPELQVGIARLEMNEGEHAKALQRLDGVKAEEVDTRWKTCVLRAHCLKALGRLDEAESAVQTAESVAGSNWSSARLRTELGLAAPQAQGQAEVATDSSAATQAAAPNGR
ncbi:MAG: tetratricopeptide repeat protein [Planctomycetes bacterium]|nr:tetratricopeptide repeat protein [Planctomycetota bacterium]